MLACCALGVVVLVNSGLVRVSLGPASSTPTIGLSPVAAASGTPTPTPTTASTFTVPGALPTATFVVPGASGTLPATPTQGPLPTSATGRWWDSGRCIGPAGSDIGWSQAQSAGSSLGRFAAFPTSKLSDPEPARIVIPAGALVGSCRNASGSWRPLTTGEALDLGPAWDLGVINGIHWALSPRCGNPLQWPEPATPAPTPTPTSTPVPGQPSPTPAPTSTPPPTNTPAPPTSTPTSTPTNPPTVTPTVDLHVELRPVPDNGLAPLISNLTTQVYGSAQGNILYQFSCDGSNFGGWSPSPVQLCTYQAAGMYRPAVRVQRQGLTASGNATVNVVAPATNTPVPTATLAPPTLSVSLAPQPNTGSAPLTSSLIANVSGTATGDIVYSFDCTGDGAWEYVSTSSSSSATASCTYLTPGNYRPKVQVVRQGLTIIGDADVIVR
ncbi:MAG: hypothetical protein HY577_01600 [Candidatus Nealsonbacteria bacterium]|nr:hypothetical protein [Candidatus Nealsonbacteria bacterium]